MNTNFYSIPKYWEGPGHAFAQLALGVGTIYFGAALRLRDGWLSGPYWSTALRAPIETIRIYLGWWLICISFDEPGASE